MQSSPQNDPEMMQAVPNDHHYDCHESMENICTKANQDNINLEVPFEGIEQLQSIHNSRMTKLKAEFGDQHSNIAVFCINLAAAYNSLGYYNEAIKLYSEALQIKKTIFGDQDSAILHLYNRLASVYRSLENYQKALEMFSWSLELSKTLFGATSLNVAALYANLASVYRATGDYKKADKLSRKYFDIIDVIRKKKIIDNSQDSSASDVGDEEKTSDHAHSSDSDPSEMNQEGIDAIESDILIICPASELAKLFFMGRPIAWYNPNSDSESSIENLSQLRLIGDVEVFKTWQETAEYIKNSSVPCRVISSGDDGKLLVKQISNHKNTLSVHIFCDDIKAHRKWIKRYPKVTDIDDKFPAVFDKLHRNSFKLNFPAFAPVFNDTDTSKMNKLHFYLKGFVNFKDRHQAKNDFIALAKKVYRQDKSIDEFAAVYNEYDIKTIFSWYTRECFFYKAINNCLRIATSDSILYSRLMIRDLELAIREQYQTKSKYFNGLLYRGTYLSDDEWRNLEEHKGKEIEMFGFLSTSKSKNVAVEFIQKDMSKKVFITVIIPATSGEEKQGFAEIQEFSKFTEEEVLFNVRSRFTVLEAATELITSNSAGCRHLVLLYGAGGMRKYISDSNPTLEIPIKDKTDIECKVCQCNIKSANNKLRVFFIDLTNSDNHICMKCMNSSEIHKSSPYICISLDKMQNHLQANTNIVVKGAILKYKEAPRIPFFGSKCQGTDHQKGKPVSQQFSCIDCSGSNKVWCIECFNYENKCLESGHNIIVENTPFTFWHEGMSLNEKQLHHYQKEKQREDDLHHGKIFANTQEYEKAKQYYECFFSRNKDVENQNTASSYNVFSMVCSRLDNIEKSEEYSKRSLEITRKIFGDHHLRTSAAYNNLANIYKSRKDYQKAKELYYKAFDIAKAELGEQDADLVAVCTNLGTIHEDLKDYHKAVELHAKSLQISEAALGERDYQRVYLYINLGNGYLGLSEYKKALNFYYQALETSLAVFGELHNNTLIVYERLGLAHLGSKDYQKALEFQNKHLDVTKAIYGEQNFHTSNSFDRLASIYFQVQDYQKAIDCFDKSLEARDHMLEQPGVETATCYNNIALAYCNVGNSQKAIEIFLKALESLKAVGKETDKLAGTVYNGLGLVYVNMNLYKKAVEMFSQELEIMKITCGEQHAKTAMSYEHLGVAYYYVGDYQRALELYFCSLEIVRTSSEDQDQDESIPSIYYNIANAFSGLQDYAESRQYYSLASQFVEKLSNKQSPRIIDLCNTLARIYVRMENYQKVIDLYSKSLEISKEVYGEQHQNTLSCYVNLADAYNDFKDYEKAAELYSWSIELNKAFSGEQSYELLLLYSKLAEVFFRLEDYQETIDLFSKALEISKSIFGDHHPYTIRAFKNLAEAYDSVGENELAKEILNSIENSIE